MQKRPILANNKREKNCEKCNTGKQQTHPNVQNQDRHKRVHPFRFCSWDVLEQAQGLSGAKGGRPRGDTWKPMVDCVQGAHTCQNASNCAWEIGFVVFVFYL